MKTHKQHLITIILTLFLGLCSIHASAQTVTFTVQTSHSDRGKVRYKFSYQTDYNAQANSYSVTANVGDVITVSAVPSGTTYGFSYWDFAMTNPPIEGTNVSGYAFTVTASHDGATITAQFTSWSCTDLTSGVTYTLTTSGDDFMVSCPGDTRFNGKVFSYIDKVELSTVGGTATIEFNTSKTVWVLKRFRVVNGFLTLKLGDSYTAGHSTIQRDPRNAGNSTVDHNLVLADPPISQSDATKCQLKIEGKPTANFVIHGNCDDMAINETEPNNIHFTATSGTKSEHALMFIGGGTVSMNYVTFTHAWNKQDSNPGGIYVFRSSTNITMPAKVTMRNSLIEWCYSTTYGAGITIYNENLSGSTFEMTDCEVSNCNTYGTTNECGGVIRTNSTSVCALTLTNCELHHNYSNYGGGAIRWNSSTASLQLTGCTLRDNWTGGSSAKWTGGSGGALLAESNVTVSGCTIRNNTATDKGGGIYVGGGTLTLTGTNVIQNNHASTNGGGIYQNGTMNINSSSFTVSGNTSDAAKTLVDNNIYLPTDKTIKVGDLGTAAGLNIRVRTQSDASVGTDIEVLTADDDDNLTAVYTALQNGTAHLIDDKQIHKVKYTSGATSLYFALPTYDKGPYVDTQPFVGPITIADSLYKYMCWVNGVNGFSSKHESATGNVTADINMSGYNHWVPIGEKVNAAAPTTAFTGSFNGNGHVISGLTIDGSADYTNYGLFGQTSGATIKDVFMQNVNFTKSSEDGTLGGIVGLMAGGTLSQCGVSCGASGSLTATDDGCIAGGLVGSMTSGTVHSCYATAELKGYKMGGLVGQLASGSYLYNSFANPKFTYSGSDDSYFAGGLVAVNSGTVLNCYVRFTRESSLGSAKFGQIVGQNSGSVTICYNPTTYNTSISSALVNDGSVTSTIYGNVVAPYLYNHSNDNLVGSTTVTLCNKLNEWVTTNNSTPGQPTCATWKRTTAGGTAYSATAGDINGDYPIHKYTGYTCVASPDGISLDYAPHLYNILKRHTSNATVNLYANDTTTASTGSNVVVYIDEDICLLQDVGAATPSSSITAYTCQTIDGTPRSWHFISSSLSNSGIGFNYGQNASFNWEPNPCNVTINSNDGQSLFPSDLLVGGSADLSKIDLYCFYEPEYHWINLKRNSTSHWHMNAHAVPITYDNETTLTPGKGYLISIGQDQLLQNKGTLNNGEVEVGLGYTPDQAWAGLLGYNLIGNPYQSYLDFSAFAEDSQNSSLWYDKSKGRAVEPTYAVYDAEKGGYVQYKQGASRGARTASGTLNMHQGFMVRSSGATRAKFTNIMRIDVKGDAAFRGEQPAYPLVNLTVTDSEGVNDFAVLELGRDTDAGAEKLRANDSKGWLYLHHNDDDYGILFRSEIEDYQPLWFDASEAGTYTLTWETANGVFDELTLVDNITGVVTDMLGTDSYMFEANPDQYKSRFKIVIGDYKDIEENEGGVSTGAATDESFAYYANGEIHLVETQNFASLQIVDMTGRVILSRDGVHTVSTNGIVPGVYVLRLTTDKGTKIQKMVIE